MSLSQTKLNLMADHHKQRNVQWKYWIVVFKVKVTAKVKHFNYVSLDDILWIAEPFVTKPSMEIHHYKPECCVQKMGCYLQGQGHSNWVWVHTMKSWLFLLYVLNCWLFGNQLSLTVHVRNLEYLVKRMLCCIQGQGHSEGSELQSVFARTISLIDQI